MHEKSHICKYYKISNACMEQKVKMKEDNANISILKCPAAVIPKLLPPYGLLLGLGGSKKAIFKIFQRGVSERGHPEVPGVQGQGDDTWSPLTRNFFIQKCFI